MTKTIKHQPDSIRLTLLEFVSSTSEISRSNEISRIRQYEDWLGSRDQHLLSVNLADYRDHLLSRTPKLKASSINAHLKTIRGRYRKMMKSDRYRNALMQLATQYSSRSGSGSISDLLAVANEFEKRIANRVFSDDIFVKEITIQDWSDEDRGIRLTGAAVTELLTAPGLKTLSGIRDTALLALMVCTGIREHEAVALDVEDLRVHLQGVLCLRVRDGKGAKQRLIPYGTLAWCLDYVDLWLENTKITTGPVFRGFWGDSQSLRNTRLVVRQVNRILNNYPVMIDGVVKRVKPHDLRRTYARLQFESGMQAEALQQNMGHASYDTTLGYIGTLDATKRMSKVDMKPPKQS